MLKNYGDSAFRQPLEPATKPALPPCGTRRLSSYFRNSALNRARALAQVDERSR